MGGMELQNTLVMMQLDLTSQMLELPDAARSSPGYGEGKRGPGGEGDISLVIASEGKPCGHNSRAERRPTNGDSSSLIQ